MIPQRLALAGVLLALAALPAAAHSGRPNNNGIILIGAGSAFAAFGIGAALLGTHAPALSMPTPGVVYLPPFSYLPPAAAPPVVYTPAVPRS
jgi:hypothetical protein